MGAPPEGGARRRGAAPAPRKRRPDAPKRASEESARRRRRLLALQTQMGALSPALPRLRGGGEQLARDLAEIQRRQIQNFLKADPQYGNGVAQALGLKVEAATRN